MASKFSTFLGLFMVFDLVFFSLVSACGECGGGGGGGSPYSKPRPRPHPRPSPGGGYPGSGGSPGAGGSGGYPGSGGSPGTGGSGGLIPGIGGPGGLIPGIGGPGGSIPGIGGPGGSSGGGGSFGKCPMDALKLGVCANVLNGLLNITLGTPPKTPCCPLIQGLVDAEVAVCLCTAIKANILGIHLNIPLSLSLLVNYCGRDVPRGFQCP